MRGWIVELVSLSEIAASSRRGRNQLRIAFGLGTVAAAGFCLAKLFDSAGWTFGIRFWTLAAIAIMMIRLAIWLFLKIEGGRE